MEESRSTFIVSQIHRLFLTQSIREPVKAFIESIASGGTCCLHVPLAVTDGVESKAFSDFVDTHSIGQILFVGKDEKNGVAEFIFCEHAVQFLTGAVLLSSSGIVNTFAIIGINDKDDTLGVLVVVPPERTDLVLTSDIPNGETDVLVLNRLDIESYENEMGIGNKTYR